MDSNTVETFKLIGGVIGGFILGLLTNLISPPIYEWLWRKYKLWMLRRSTHPKTPEIIGPSPLKAIMSVGGMTIDWIVLQYARYRPSHIQSTYDPTKIPLIPEFERLRLAYISDYKQKKKEGQTGLPYNSAMYKLKKFDVGHREIIDNEEVPILRMAFGPTDYFTQIVTDLNIGNPIRERCARAVDITLEPVPDFSSLLGVNLNLITKDGYLIITERSGRVHVAGNRLHTSVGENLLRPTDAGANGAPDPFRCAIRGAREEIGVVLRVEDVELTAFGVQPKLCQYSLIGWSRLDETRAEVEELRALAVPKDKYESKQLIFVPCNPDAIAEFTLNNWDRWFPIGLAAVVLSIFQFEYSAKEVNQAFVQRQKAS